jgi:methylmalonyl-CoA/ethylmalonyl-CoA epimerase
MKLGYYCVELIAPKDESSSINSIIKKNGNTPYHICYSVDNIIEAIEDFKKNGYILIGEPEMAVAIDSKKVVFLYNKHMGIIELVEEIN